MGMRTQEMLELLSGAWFKIHEIPLECSQPGIGTAMRIMNEYCYIA